MARSQAVSPTPRQVEAHLRRLETAHPRLVRVESAGTSAQGRAILAAAVTSPGRDDDKQHVLIVAGQHGNEESGRMVALATLDYLASRAGAETRRHQKVVVLPCVNPDGAAIDGHNTPTNVAPNLDHADSGATSPEGLAVERVANALSPELFVDMHACGYSGCSYDMVLWPDTKPYTEDDALLHAIGAEMAAAGEAAGIPHVTHPLTWPGWGDAGFDQPSTTCWMYRQFKSMVFLTETAEDNRHAYPAADRVRSGLARIKTLLAHGNRRHPKLSTAGYPCSLALGMFVSGIVAIGRSAAERRAGRVAIWRSREHFVKLDRCTPIRRDAKRVLLAYDGEPLAGGVGIQTYVRGRRRVTSARLNGRRLRRSPTDGYTTWRDGCTTFVVAAIPELRAGEHVLDLRFD